VKLDKVAFAFRLAPERVQLVDDLLRQVALDPEVDRISREVGAQRSLAWLQEGERPLLIVYTEWKVDPIEGFGSFEASTEEVADRVRSVIRQLIRDPEDSAVDVAAGRSHLILDWAAADGSRGAELRCYARFVPRTRVGAVREFLLDLQHDPALLNVYSRLRERAGMKRVSLWMEDVALDEVLMIEMYESDDLDAAFSHLASSPFDLERHITNLAVHSLGWMPDAMPKVREIYRWNS